MKRSVILNLARLNFDNLDLSSIAAVTEVSRYDDSTPYEIVERVAGQEIVITKELPVQGRPANVVN